MVDQTFSFLHAQSLVGDFSRIENQNFNDGTQHWDVGFQGTSLILTAEAGPAPGVPDQGSTLLLLTLSLLGLVTYHQALRQKAA
jgi:hypothetical protein